MKVTININGVDVEIQLTPEQEALALNQAKPKFEWTYTKDDTYLVSAVYTKCVEGSNTDSIEHGRYRKTQQTAEQSLARNKRANRLEALAEQLNGLTKFVVYSSNYYIYCMNKEWSIGTATEAFYPEVIHMTEACAIEICRMLNAGEFSLDNEL